MHIKFFTALHKISQNYYLQSFESTLPTVYSKYDLFLVKIMKQVKDNIKVTKDGQGAI